MRQYEAYKDSYLPWGAEIPQHWEVKKLKFIANSVLGKMLQGEDKGANVLKPYLRSTNIQWARPDVSDVKEMWFSSSELNQYRIARNDVLVNEGGDVGRACLWDDELNECYIQNSVHKVTARNGLHPMYLLYLFFCVGKAGHFDAVVNRVSIAHLTREKLVNIGFVLPPYEEQKAIVRYLDKKLEQIEQLIKNKQRLIEMLEEQRRVVIERAVTKGLKPGISIDMFPNSYQASQRFHRPAETTSTSSSKLSLWLR